MLETIKHKFPGSNISITAMYEQPFGRLGNRKLEDISDPRESKEMPF